MDSGLSASLSPGMTLLGFNAMPTRAERSRRKSLVMELQRKSSRDREWILKSKICACFRCFAEFEATRITEWIDKGETALCPICTVDSVIGFGEAVDHELLHQMHRRWFSETLR
jgi:hypothetical protein